MKPRLIATFKENRVGLFQSLRNTFDKFLARDPIDWKRSFGRPSRNVFIQLVFDSFDPNSIVLEESWLLCDRPFLHTFWIDCDLETYKTSVKESVSGWLSQLREKDINDWLVVVVVSMDNKVKNKLLRNSVYDKVKNDFCSKQVERCILLSEPYKLDSKSLESFGQVACRMRVLVVDSITKVLDRFEENMRSQRERRIEHEWNFCSYFLLQEELAFMYEMMGLYEDAMIQYDELDALFTQFILNSAIAEPAPWLELMCRNIPTRWGGSCLCRPIDCFTRDLISLNKCSILDLRSYLFGRQGHLLVQLSRISELVKRSVPFIHNCIREVKILKIELPPGAVDCWTFLSCMEVLNFCPLDSKVDSEDSRVIACGAAELWNLATQKANCIGRLCGLVKISNKQTPEELHIVEVLLPGLVHAAGDSEHLTRLVEVLSCKDPYIQFYLDLSEQCICFLKHVSRIRSAKFIRKELADLYIMTGNYEKAENYLTDLLKMYKTEGWEMLANDVRQKVAECQKFLNQTFKFCTTCLNIASSSTVPQEVRVKYLNDALEASKNHVDTGRMNMRSPPAFLVSISIPSTAVALHQSVKVQVEIFSNLPCSLTLDEITLSFISKDNAEEKDRDSEINNKHKRNFSTDSTTIHSQAQKLKQRCHSRQSSGHFEMSRNVQSSILGGFELFNKISETINFNLQPIDIQSSVQYINDGNQSLAMSSSLFCGSPLKRCISSPKSQRLLSAGHVASEVDVVFKSGEMSILKGRNSFELDGVFSEAGSYHANLAVMKLNQIDFVQTLYSEDLNIDITLQEIKLHLSKTDFVAGFKQKFEITSPTEALESFVLKSLEIVATEGLVLQCGNLSNNEEKMILSEEGLETLKMKRCLCFVAFVPLSNWVQDETLLKEITLRSPDHIDNKCALSFRNPFSICHKIFSSPSKKFVEVAVSSGHVNAIKISSWSLIDSLSSMIFKNLNINNTMLLHPGATLTFVWQLDGNQSHSSDLKFHMNYHEVDQSDVIYDLGYHFHLDDVEIRIILHTHLNGKEVTLNEWIPITFTITRVKDTPHLNRLFYQINMKRWELKGSRSGEVNLTDNQAKIKVEARPLKCGQVFLPKIILFREISQGNSDGAVLPDKSCLTKLDTSWTFDSSEVTAVSVKPSNPSPLIHHFCVAEVISP